MSKEACALHKTKIGGQALIEGVMMRGIEKASMAVRLPSGEIDLEVWPLKKATIFNKIPIIRGVVNFVQSMASGYKCLSKSAEKAGLDDEEYEMSKFEQWLSDKLGDKLMSVFTVIGLVLGVILAVVLFMFLPMLAVQGLELLIPLGPWKTLIEGLVKIAVFVVYLALTARMDMMKRVYGYHGAEHKTIFCYEAGLPLTVENVRKQRRFHPRCGTSFIVIVLILSILVFSTVTWDVLWIRMLLKISLLPVVAGVAYEFIKLAGRYDNVVTRILSAPGLWLQNLTTVEPDDGQIEVAIAAMEPVLPENREDDRW